MKFNQLEQALIVSCAAVFLLSAANELEMTTAEMAVASIITNERIEIRSSRSLIGFDRRRLHRFRLPPDLETSARARCDLF